MSLVLSLFPGIGLLDMAFEEEGFCVVRGPDLLWGGDIKRFHPPAGRFEGVIGGPPCQIFSIMKRLNPKAGEKHGNLIPEFERVVDEALPEWFVMENVLGAPTPKVEHYGVHSVKLNNRWLGEEQHRERRFSFGVKYREGVRLRIETVALESALKTRAITGDARQVPVKIGGTGKYKGGGMLPNTGKKLPTAEMLRLQGVEDPEWLGESPFTESARRQMIGNGVPVAMGRAVAKAVKRALAVERVA